ncbi:DNA repair protein RadA [[Actinomadura] parvosata subsp. kistnae]|uniref:DNA repair protein RadA n=2 Tax=Nonomuraea TaxID=83681 RepID=A0A1V0ACV2_9ACTN|nr:MULTISPECIES: DNA repair protein RadA [unclassified Nonomuraea]AQZ68051.1 DNA repair protein RadA [Nonomuraea sp. ATCC 55076]NJP96190.1 DNA repair protein RadA [Nonomuraea sp. FMUSA5-5]SPL93571.1 DNA repair protein RadA [Actinomadura parvosata subsp. kistnae]
MAKTAQKPGYRCAECGWRTTKWVGRCGECQAWGTVDEEGARAGVNVVQAGATTAPALPIGQVKAEVATARTTGVAELDRVLGGGLVPGAVVLLAGEPGIGKSTLLLEAAARIAERATVLYVTGEESAAQVRLRADRIGAIQDQLYLAAETELSALVTHVEKVQPRLLVVDSVQTIGSAQATGVPGGVTQVREVAANLVRMAKERNMATVLVGHVTKEGSIAGPRTLEHLVDVVLNFEGDRHSRLRMVRAIKNRFGPTDEIGCFDLHERGIEGITDPSGLFVSRRSEPVPGTCVTVTVEGTRPLPAEVQALVARTDAQQPRRTSSGLDTYRVQMILAVLERRLNARLGGCDVFTATVGGIKLADPAVDLSVMLAVASAAGDKPLPPGLVALGEVGLAGELRPVKDVRRRLTEAARLGFKRALVPAGSLEESGTRRGGQRALVPVGPVAFAPGFEVVQAENVWDALTHVT